MVYILSAKIFNYHFLLINANKNFHTIKQLPKPHKLLAANEKEFCKFLVTFKTQICVKKRTHTHTQQIIHTY